MGTYMIILEKVVEIDAFFEKKLCSLLSGVVSVLACLMRSAERKSVIYVTGSQ